MGANILNSWKEISQYLGRGVRTAQRWERDLGLPVHRPRGRNRSAVIALVDEVDAWLRNCPEHPTPNGHNSERDSQERVSAGSAR
jgi:hypothetical protein